MKILAKGFVYDASQQPGEGYRVASFTGLYVAQSGSIFCTFQCGSKKHALNSTVRIFRSRDEGRNWSDTGARFSSTLNDIPGSLSSGEITDVGEGRIMIICTWFDRRNPALPLFDPVTEGLLPSKQIAAFSSDDGASWTAWEEIPIPLLKGCASTGPLVRWSDGTIAFPFESYKEFDDPGPASHGAWIIISRDGGNTFEEPVLIARDPKSKVYYWDQRLCAGASLGSYIAMFWTHDLEHKCDLNVHLTIADVNSDQAPLVVETEIPGQISAPLLLEDGRLLAFVVNRSSPGTLTLWSSHDSGKHWPHRIVLHYHDEKSILSQGKENIDFAQYWEDMGKWSFGHPAVRQLNSGKVLVTYYAGDPNCLSIHWAEVDVGKPPH
jgi:hypothetical protein